MIFKYKHSNRSTHLKVLIGYKLTRLGLANSDELSSMFTTINEIPQSENELEALGQTVLKELRPKRPVECRVRIISLSRL